MIAKYDLGHGGPIEKHQIIHVNDHYEIKVTTSRQGPTPGEKDFKPSIKVTDASKTPAEIDNLLDTLIEEFKIFELSDLKATRRFLYPTIYSFKISNSCGKFNNFTYAIEFHHIDKKYEKLINTIYSFFDK